VNGPNSLWVEDATKLAVGNAERQTEKEKLANQLYYGNVGQTGKFYGYEGMGYGGTAEALNPFINYESSGVPIYIVPHNQPTVKVWLVDEGGAEETLNEQEVLKPLREQFEAIPLPFPALVPKGTLPAEGSDHHLSIIQPGSDKRWFMRRLSQFASGPLQGEWKFGFGYYQAEQSKWNGINEGHGQESAAGLSHAGGVISLADIVRVLRGGKIGHALYLSVLCTSGAKLAPAVDSDTHANTFEFQKDGKTPNPAFGTVDEIAEGLWLRFPPASLPGEYGITTTFFAAMYEAIREHGLVVCDSGGIGFNLGDARTLFTPYCDTNFNPFVGSSYFAAHPYWETGTTEAQRGGWTDPTLPTWAGALNGAESQIHLFPWRELEALAPRSS
jgi:hypothetical protein